MPKRGSSSSKGKQKMIDEPTKPELMQAVVVTQPGGPKVLEVKYVPLPELGKYDVLLKVSYVGVNRPDIEQRKSQFRSLPLKIEEGERVVRSEYLGLECSGHIVKYGKGLTETQMNEWPSSKEVCAILCGGGYAEYVAVPLGYLLPKPNCLTLKEAASLPQAACIVWTELFMSTRIDARICARGDPFVTGPRLRSGQTILIHGGCSEIGSVAIQMAKEKGATVYATSDSEQKKLKCLELGADVSINNNVTPDFDEEVLRTQQQGVDVILDCVGEKYKSKYDEKQKNCLKAEGGILIRIGSSSYDESNLKENRIKYYRVGDFERKRPSMRTLVVDEVNKNVWPMIEKGVLRPFLHTGKEFKFKDAAEAHKMLEEGKNFGKIVLENPY